MAKILVTGGAGFIGSNFIRYWTQTHPKDRITNLDSLTYAASTDTLRDLDASRVRFINGDISDKKLVPSLARGADSIFHFAAETHVDRSIIDPQIFLKTNVLGTQNLLEAVRVNGVGKFVHVSTDEVYGSIQKGKFSESSFLAPNSPYAASKASSDLLCRSYWRTYKTPVVITRCSNNFGPYQFPEKVIPLFVTNLIEGKKIPVYGRGLNVREWIYVTDHCRAIEAVYLKGSPGESYNIGSGYEISNSVLAKKILELFGLPESRIEYVKDRPGHDFRYSLDSSKLKRLGWKPEYRFEEAIAQTVRWYEDHQDWWRKIKKRGAYQTYVKKQYKK